MPSSIHLASLGALVVVVFLASLPLPAEEKKDPQIPLKVGISRSGLGMAYSSISPSGWSRPPCPCGRRW